jgi:hypothetical protein
MSENFQDAGIVRKLLRDLCGLKTSDRKSLGDFMGMPMRPQESEFDHIKRMVDTSNQRGDIDMLVVLTATRTKIQNAINSHRPV